MMNEAIWNSTRDFQQLERTAEAARRPDPEERALREACVQFEGLLLGIMLKEGMRDVLAETSPEGASSMEQFKEFTIEQVAQTMAEESSIGIADQLYEQFTHPGVLR